MWSEHILHSRATVSNMLCRRLQRLDKPLIFTSSWSHGMHFSYSHIFAVLCTNVVESKLVNGKLLYTKELMLVYTCKNGQSFAIEGLTMAAALWFMLKACQQLHCYDYVANSGFVATVFVMESISSLAFECMDSLWLWNEHFYSETVKWMLRSW